MVTEVRLDLCLHVVGWKCTVSRAKEAEHKTTWLEPGHGPHRNPEGTVTRDAGRKPGDAVECFTCWKKSFLLLM